MMDSIISPVLLLCFSLKECLPCRALGQIVSPKQGRHLTVFPASVKATEWIQCCFTTNAPAHWNCRFACARLKQKRWRIVNVESKIFVLKQNHHWKIIKIEAFLLKRFGGLLGVIRCPSFCELPNSWINLEPNNTPSASVMRWEDMGRRVAHTLEPRSEEKPSQSCWCFPQSGSARSGSTWTWIHVKGILPAFVAERIAWSYYF